MLTWKDVINFSVVGNPKPEKRVDKTEADPKNTVLDIKGLRVIDEKGVERERP